jgi:sugar/nucleoside kinase (ribokinase family)
VNSAQQLDVAVVGELNLDLILCGLPEQLLPERELLASGLTLTLGSSSAIMAHNLAALGSRVGFISRIGEDPFGQISLERLRESGVDVSRVRRVAGPVTTGLTVILPHTHSRNILTYPGTMSEMNFADLDLEFLASARHFHLSSFFLHRALQPRIADLFRTMKSAGLTTSLDVNDDPQDRWDSGLWGVLPHVDIFFLNERELRKVTGAEDLQSGIDRLSSTVSIVVVKLGAEGAVATHDGNHFRASAAPVTVVDPVGAGDSFDAGFLHQFVRGAELQWCLEYGNLAGGFSTTRPGGTEAFRDRKHLESFFEAHWPSQVGR